MDSHAHEDWSMTLSEYWLLESVTLRELFNVRRIQCTEIVTVNVSSVNANNENVTVVMITPTERLQLEIQVLVQRYW